MTDGTKKQQKTKDFRYVFANTFGLKISDGDTAVVFGHEQQTGPDDATVHEEVGVIMTHRGIKLLSILLTEAIKDFEEANGLTIEVPKEKVEMITKAMAAHKVKREAARKEAKAKGS